MKRLYIILLGAGLLMSSSVYAQQDTTTALTVEQCIDFALKHAIASQNAMLDQQIAEAKVKETIGIGLPQISASGSTVYNPLLPRFFATYLDAAHSGGGGFSFISDAQAQQLGLKNGDIFASKNFFQLQASGNASVTANQLIFNGSYFVGLQASKTYRELALRAANLTREQIIVQVTKAYYGVIINKERVSLFTNNIARVDSLLKNTKALNENGFAEGIDVDRIQVNLNNLIVERDKFLNLNELSMALLKFQMNYPMEQPLRLTAQIKDVDVSSEIDSFSQDWNYKLRPDYLSLDASRKLQELNVKNKYAAGMPSMVAFGTMGYSTQSPTISGVFKTNSNFRDMGTIGPDKWYQFTQVGVSLNIPLFSGGQRHYQIQQEKINLAKIQNNFINLKNGIDLEVKQSTLSFENALKTLSAQKSNMDLASRVARITKIKYDQGVGSNLEVVDAESSLRTAQTNYYNALYDAMVAKIDVEKAFGKILNTTTK